MARAFDPGYGSEPFRSLVADVPGASVYPAAELHNTEQMHSERGNATLLAVAVAVEAGRRGHARVR